MVPNGSITWNACSGRFDGSKQKQIAADIDDAGLHALQRVGDLHHRAAVALDELDLVLVRSATRFVTSGTKKFCIRLT